MLDFFRRLVESIEARFECWIANDKATQELVFFLQPRDLDRHSLVSCGNHQVLIHVAHLVVRRLHLIEHAFHLLGDGFESDGSHDASLPISFFELYRYDPNKELL